MKKIIAGIGAFALSFSMVNVAMAATTNVQQATSATVADNLTLVCGDVDVDGGVPIVADGATVEENTTTCAVTTNDAGGFDLQIREDTQLIHTDAATTIANKTAWTPGTPNAAAYTGTGLGFRVASISGETAPIDAKNDTWWGSATTCSGGGATELYAGLPGALADVVQENDYNSGTVTTTFCYATAVPSTQKSGEYTGQVTYSVTTPA